MPLPLTFWSVCRIPPAPDSFAASGAVLTQRNGAHSCCLSLMWVAVAAGGVNGLDWLWIALAVVADIAMWSGGAWGNRDRISGSRAT